MHYLRNNLKQFEVIEKEFKLSHSETKIVIQNSSSGEIITLFFFGTSNWNFFLEISRSKKFFSRFGNQIM